KPSPPRALPAWGSESQRTMASDEAFWAPMAGAICQKVPRRFRTASETLGVSSCQNLLTPKSGKPLGRGSSGEDRDASVTARGRVELVRASGAIRPEGKAPPSRGGDGLHGSRALGDFPRGYEESQIGRASCRER